MTTVASRQEHDDSGEYSDASQDIEHNNSGNDGVQQESDYDSQSSDSEHSDGDPDKQEAEKRVDDDEDRSNPQYIPKRGTFYEHDDRTAASGEETSNTTSEAVSESKEGTETPTERRRPPRKSESLNKWSHDKYNETEQVPKSRDELVAIYGYDIRNEDAPPHARRNRRYGRGPNKYTRTWEDEEAYKRQAGAAQPPKKPPSPADFPELGAANKPGRRTRAPRPRSKSQPTSNDSSESGSQLRRNASIKSTRTNNQRQIKPMMNKPIKPMKDKIPLENLTISTTVTNNSQGPPQRRVNATVAQQRPLLSEQVKKKPTPAQTMPQSNAVQSKPQAPSHQKQAALKSQQQPSQSQTTGVESRGGSKRYSSLRQRPLAETYSPQQPQQPAQPVQQQPQAQQQPQQQQTLPQQPQQPQQQQNQQHRYHADFAGAPPAAQHQGSPGPIHPQQIIHQQVHRNPAAQTAHGPSPPHQALPQPALNQPQVRLGLMEQQQIVSHPHHTLHNIPQQHSIGQIPPAQGYAPPAMMPAQYMQQGNNNGVFTGAPIYQPPAAYPHQLYQHHNYATQAGGVTYYSCAEQEQAPRAQRRPTAAIPIVRPAPVPVHADRSVNSSDKDNIDRIVENMFVRKPYKSTNEDASKDKQERSSQEPQSKDSSQPNSLTSSSISTDSKPADRIEQKQDEEKAEKEPKEKVESEIVNTETITTDA